MARGGEGMGEPHARGIPWWLRPSGGEPWRPGGLHPGGGSKSSAWPPPAPHPYPLAGFFFRLRIFERRGDDRGRRRAERGQPGGSGLRPSKRCAASLPRPRQPDPGVIAGLVCHNAQRADFGRIIFPFSGRLSGRYVWEGNNGNMGTSYVRQAESRASGGCAPVPKPSGGFGNMGTEIADPDAGKSARVWLPPAPSSR